MLQKLSFTHIVAAIQKQVEEYTGLECYDSVPENAPVPFYHVQIIGTLPEPSKTMQKDRYQTVIHVFTEGNGSVAAFDAIQRLEEALTEEITLPEDYEVTLQIPNGVSQILDEADGTKHAVIGYDFVVFSGYKIKY